VVQLQAELEVKVAESNGELHAANDELDALRRVATLVARGVPSAEIFSAVSVEVSRLFGSDISAIVRFERYGTATAMGVHGRPHTLGARFQLEPGSARMPDVLRTLGIHSGVASPIVVHGEPWGALVAATAGSESLLEDPETRIAGFAELVATSVSNAEAWENLHRVADEHAALRRVAMLIAEDAPASELFLAVTREVGVLLGADISGMARFEGDAAVTTATWAVDGKDPPIPDPWQMDPGDPAGAIADARRVVRWDDWTQVPGPAAAFAREELGVRSTVGAPIVVQGQSWGVLAVHSKQPTPLPADTESRLQQFSDLVATAIGNAEARTEVAKLANEHAALRRVATLVARAPASEELFPTVAREVATVLDAPGVLVERFETDGAVTVGVAYDVDLMGAETSFGVGTRMARDPGSLSAQVFETRRTARVDYSRLPGTIGDAARAAGLGSGVAGPILVDGELWGQMCVFSRAGTVLPVGTEDRLHDFIELVATAIANYEARAGLSTLADEQAALRRVAMLVAEDAPPDELFRTVTNEVGTLLVADFSGLARFEEGTVVPLAVWAAEGQHPPVPDRWPMQPGDPVTAIAEARQAVRWDDWSQVSGPIAAFIREELGVRSTVGTPIVVEGRLWGALAVHSKHPLPQDSESRIERFSELVATAIANTDSRAELAASRKRIVAAWDEARRRIERDLHDGTQQRLVSLGLAIRAAETDVPPEQSGLRSELSRIASGLGSAAAELQEISRGIHPAILAQGGLAPALRTLARRSTIPVELEVTTGARLPEPIEVAAYYVASEALANTAKHAHASHIEMSLERRDTGLLLEIRDDGVGGADPTGGSGLLGLRDRVEALGGSIRIQSQPGNGTSITVELPLEPDVLRESLEST
jgi:signal transduction histidine kinase